MPLYDFECPACGERFEEIARLEDSVACPACKVSFEARANHFIGAPKQFNVIIPTYPGAKKHKAGY
ncbi:MAG: FmdB family zinc ribbon protein, partial [Brooklawnia sp.]